MVLKISLEIERKFAPFASNRAPILKIEEIVDDFYNIDSDSEETKSAEESDGGFYKIESKSDKEEEDWESEPRG